MQNIIFLPFVTWFITGVLKFFVSVVKSRKVKLSHIGYGGFPSNHTSIVCSTCSFLYFSYGGEHPATLVAITFAFITILDASSLRRQIGKQAEKINSLISDEQLRERVGHTKPEIIGGAVVGSLTGYAFFLIF